VCLRPLGHLSARYPEIRWVVHRYTKATERVQSFDFAAVFRENGCLVKRFLNLYSILLLGAALRVVFAFNSLGFEHPTENYRLLEPIASLQGYSVRLPWEWTEGLLSKIPIFFQYFYLSTIAKLGVTTAEGQLIALRLLYGMLSLFQILAAWRITLRTSNSRKVAAVSALLVATWPEIVYRSVRLMDYSLEASLLAMVLILVFTTKRRHREIYVSLAGMILGALFFVRFQTGMYFIVIGAVLLLLKPTRWLEFIYFSVFYALTILFFGTIEARGVSEFLAPFFKFLEFNAIENGAVHLYGNQPWHRYFTELAKSFGFLPLLVFAYAFFRRKLDGKILLIFAFPFLVLSLIAHKEAYFIYGFAWLLIPLTIVGVEQAQRSKTLLTVISLCFVAGFSINLVRVMKLYDRGSETVREWGKIGQELAAEDTNRTKVVPLYIYGDPDLLPGGFFLRFTGPVCYKYGTSRQGICLKTVNEFRTLRLRKPNGDAIELTSEKKEGKDVRDLPDFKDAKWRLSPVQQIPLLLGS
jgi:hypothetical protein